MSLWAAVLWGGLASSSLYVGQALARPLQRSTRATGLIMGFGAGTLLSAVAYQLVPESSLDDSLEIGLGLGLGALTYFVADWLVDSRGGADRQRIAAGEGGSGAAMFLGALLDGLPESFILGATLAIGGEISIAFLAAIFVSNIPQGVAGTTSLEAAGYTGRRVFAMWTWLTIGCAAIAGLGFLFADSLPDQGVAAEAFAAGALLMMLADSMMPEAFAHGGKAVGLMTVLGYLVAAALVLLQ